MKSVHFLSLIFISCLIFETSARADLTGCHANNSSGYTEATVSGSYSGIPDCFSSIKSKMSSYTSFSSLSGVTTTYGHFVAYYSGGSANFDLYGTGYSACVSPKTWNGSSCSSPACPATGTSFSSGYYDLGTVDNANNHPPISSCDSGCSTSYTGSAQSYRALVNGVYHYYSKGSYANDSTISSGACSGGAASPSSSSVLPVSTCAPGQSSIADSSGNLKCFDSGTGAAVDPNSASAVASITASDAAAAAAAGAAAASAAATAAYAQAIADGYSSASAVVISQSAGQAAAGQQAGAAAAAQVNPVDPCKDSSAVGCMQAGTDLVPDDVPLGTKNISVTSISPISVGAVGVCPAPYPMTIHGHTEYFSYTTYCNYSTGIKPIILAFAWLLAAGILVNSIKSA